MAKFRQITIAIAITIAIVVFDILMVTKAFEITGNQRPDVIVRHGDTDSIILDCLYELTETPIDELKGFTVKWFYEADIEPIYQWIPDRESTSVRGVLEDHIDVNFSISKEPYKVHRALHLKNLETNLTGLYKCVVSTFTKEEFQMQKLVIYEPEKTFDIIKVNEGPNITIICSASDLFPQPKITILMESDEQEQVFDNIENAIVRGDNGFYNITTIATVDEKFLEPVDFKCKLEIGDANYEATKGLHYYPDSASTIGSISKMVFLSLITSVLLTYNV